MREVLNYSDFRWHSAGTYDVKTKTGGPFGTIRHPDELKHEANNGLDIAVRLLEPIKEQFPVLSYADFYQVYKFLNLRTKSFSLCLTSSNCCLFFVYKLKLAGVVAVEVTGGPDIPFHPGRQVIISNMDFHFSPHKKVCMYIKSVLRTDLSLA